MEKIILNISLGRSQYGDHLIWHYDHKGSYSIKTGHKLCAEDSGAGVTSNAGLEKSWWGKLWSDQIPNKVKFF